MEWVSTYFRLLLLLKFTTVSTVFGGELVGSAEFYKLGSTNGDAHNLDTSETLAPTLSLQATPEVTFRSYASHLSEIDSSIRIMTVTATRIGTSRHFQSHTPTPVFTTPFPSSTGGIGNSSEEVVNGSVSVLDSSSRESLGSKVVEDGSRDESKNEFRKEINKTSSVPKTPTEEDLNGTTNKVSGSDAFHNQNIRTTANKAINPEPSSAISTELENFEDVNSLESPQTSNPTNATGGDNDQLIENENMADEEEEEEGETVPPSSKDPVQNSTRVSGEQLPSPDALVGYGDPPQGLENEYAEALKDQDGGLNPKRRRMGPGVRRKVRMRVRKGPLQNGGGEPDEGSTSTTTEASRPRRYRSTTTIPPTIVSPDPSPPTILPKSSNNKPILIKNGPYPMVFQNDDVTPGPQLERPPKPYTEKMAPFYVSSKVVTSTPRSLENPRDGHPDNNNVTKENGEWLQAANSKLHGVHVDGRQEIFGKERDSWEKNYMNLQQNSFYRSSPEVISGEETLRSINKSKGKVKAAQSGPTAPQSEGSQQTIHVVDSDNSVEIHHHHHHSTVQGDERNEGDEDEGTVNMIVENTTREPESVFSGHPVPQFPTGRDRIGAPDPFDEELIEVVPVNNYFERSRPTLPPNGGNHPNEVVNEVTRPVESYNDDGGHYDRTRHRVTELPSGQHSSEQIYDSPPPIKDVRHNRPIANQGSQYSGGGGPTAFEGSPRDPTQSNQMSPSIHPFQSHEFLGFGAEKHLNLEKVQKGFLPGNEIFEKQHSDRNGGQKKGHLDFANPVYHKPQNFFPERPGIQHGVPEAQHPKMSSKPEYSTPSPAPFSMFPFGNKEHAQQAPPSRNVIHDLYKPAARQPASSFQPNHPNPGKSFQELEKAFYNNLMQSTNPAPPPPPHQQQHQRGGPADFPAHPRYPPRSFFGNNQKLDTVGPFGDSSNQGHHNFRGGSSSPSITLPMPGLVSIPTPPPESHALNSVYSNRHYPPHTHSMSVNPDYVPANPPLMKGHPLQYHFDPFLQNAGDYPQEKGHKSEKQPSKSQRPYFAQPSQTPPRQSYIASQPTNSQYHIEEESKEVVVPRGSRSRKRQPRKRYPKLIEPTRSKAHEVYRPSSEETSDNFNYRDERGSKKLSPAELHALHQEESRETRTRVKVYKKPKKKEDPEGPAFSENAYVLMFPNMVPEGAMLPAKPFINGKHIPVLSASDPGVFEKVVAKAASPGYHPAKVHPREQMLQVLASNHYEIEMEKYMERKKQPPLPIHTPYGLLVPMGLPNTANQNPEATSHHHYPDVESSNSNQNPRGSPPNRATSGRIPGVEDLADELMDSFSASEGDVEVINHPPQFLGVVEHHHSPYQNHDTSFSEHVPVKASPKGKQIIVSDQPKSSRVGKKSDNELKGLIKTLLREHLEELLVDLEMDGKRPNEKARKGPKVQKNRGQQSKMEESASVTTYNFLPPPPPLSQMLKTKSNPPIPVPQPPPESSTGFLDSIRRFFSFGRKAEPKTINPQHYLPINNATRPFRIDRYERLSGVNGILKKQSGVMGRLDGRRKTQLSKTKGVPQEESEGEDEEGSENRTKEKGERRPLEKLLKLLFRKSENKLVGSSTGTAGNRIIPTQIPALERVKERIPVPNPSSLRRPLPFVPSRSMEELEWTPLQFVPHHPNRVDSQTTRSEEDQIQAETRNDGMKTFTPPPPQPPKEKTPEEINEIYKNSILDYEAYEELVNKARKKYLHPGKGDLDDEDKKDPTPKSSPL